MVARILVTHYVDSEQKVPVRSYFERHPGTTESPIIQGIEEGDSCTRPHLLDEDILPLLRSLWFCLHLPISPLDFTKLQAIDLKRKELFEYGHEIALVPHDKAGEYLGELNADHVIPALLIAPDEVASKYDLHNSVGTFVLGFLPTEQVDSDLVARFWRELAGQLQAKDVTCPDPPDFCGDLRDGVTKLPLLHLLRQLAEQHLSPMDQETLKFHSGQAHTVLTATAALEENNTKPADAESLLPVLIDRLKFKPVQNLVISLPGVPKSDKSLRRSPNLSQWRDGSNKLMFMRDPGANDDYGNERRAVAVVAAYEGIAQSGVVIELPAVPDEVWKSLHDLEDHYRTPSAKNPEFIWRCLEKLADQTESLLSDGDVYSILKANRATVLSNFPFGLLTLPGDSSPLCCRLPVIQRPLTPLTRALQLSFSNPPVRVFVPEFKVLIAECLAQDDRIRRFSDAGWDIATQTLEEAGISVTRVNIDSAQHLRNEIDALRPGIMILSAHGAYSPKANSAGLMIGDEHVTHLELQQSPPLVILSACHTTPRGRGVVNPGDLFLRDGATAVLSTLVPVNVTSNATLIIRLIVNMLEAQTRDTTLNNLADIWHFTQCTNAVHDVLDGAKTIKQWGHARRNGVSPMEAFKNERSVGRLRKSHIYSDSVAVLQEIADEDGTGSRFRRWVENQGFCPESIFYTMLGWPERLHMRPANGARGDMPTDS